MALYDTTMVVKVKDGRFRESFGFRSHSDSSKTFDSVSDSDSSLLKMQLDVGSEPTL